MNEIPQRRANEFEANTSRESTQLTDEDEISDLFGSLDDGDVFAILQTVGEDPLSAKEISNRCELPMSTTYRKVNKLADAGLLEESTEISLAGKHTSKYSRCVDTIEMSITAEGFELVLSEESDIGVNARR